MRYLKRVGLSFFSGFVILIGYSLALRLPSQLSFDFFYAVAVGAIACCLVAGLIAAGLVRNNSVVMIISSQVIAIMLMGIVWRL